MLRLGFVMLLTLPLLTGCASSFIDLRENLDGHRSSFEEKLAGDPVKMEQFRACSGQAHDGSSLPLSLATDTPATQPVSAPVTSAGRLRAPVQALVERIHERAGNNATSLGVLSGMVDDFADSSRRRLDLDKLRLLTDAIRHWQAHLDFDDDALAKDASLFARLFLAYNRAYFGDVRYAIAPDPASGTVRGIVQITSRGFVDRGGNTVRFPGLSATAQIDATRTVELTTTPVNSQQVSADLTRIFLEAFFDAAFRVPAVHQATALHLPAQTPLYPAFDPSHPSISLDALATVTQRALKTEAIVLSLTGKALRGGSLFGTNNETVVATLETAAGVFAKKLVEHEGFCYFQVTPHP
ncbi:hypothetical protein [Nitrospira lenta]|uniref:Lipoprotein n=1 Tax=Nitrospira lenta TaxID=1436998 RepID=A0A330LA17_9BACT|nr:hypothetical protein [Nitrospira lenta]SPP63786.1 conserved exported hypothetical protein [Nitrospira lenta]